MTDYIDTYISGPVKADLETFARNFVNYIPVQPGRAAVAATGDTPAQTAAGDPSLFYTCVRATFDITPLVASPMAVVDAATGAAVVGVWA